MSYIPDAYEQWERHDAEQERELQKLPRCSECDEPIQNEHCYEINGELICPDCMNDNHLKLVCDVEGW